jgi:acetyl-CoA carboxylase carboxyltransferase component
MSATGKFDAIYDDYMRRRKAVLEMGGEKELGKRLEKRQTNARERIDILLDPGTFVTHRQTEFGMAGKLVPAEGVVTGYGKINGKWVVVASEDFTSMAGSFSEYHGKKFVWALDFAKEKGWPFVGINDSGGAVFRKEWMLWSPMDGPSALKSSLLVLFPRLPYF